MTSSLGSNRPSKFAVTPVDITGGLSRRTRHPGWPVDGLDLAGLRAAGWRPVPLREIVLKLHQRCNLSCDHCYVYEMADQTWRSKPVAMSRQVITTTAERIAEHARRHALPSVRVVFHGGEPLLAGTGMIVDAVKLLRATVPSTTSIAFGVQTNGVLLTQDALRTLLEHRIRVGVSIDGGGVQHDRHRHFANGRGSYAAVAAGLSLLARAPYREVFSGLLCTIDLDNDPLETYEALLAFSPPVIDFLLPHGNWTHPPPHRREGAVATPYADWLIAIFDRWYSAPQQPCRIRIFAEILSLILGGRSRIESVGLSPVGLIVVDTDGSIEQADALKSAYDGAADLGLDVGSDSFDAALSHPAIVARQIGVAALSDICRRCSARDVCGGGLYAHRYRAGEGYRNPSVFCPDLFRLIDHISRRVQRDTQALDYDQVPSHPAHRARLPRHQR